MEQSHQPSKIVGVQFSLLSSEEIRKQSVVEIVSRDTYFNGKPVLGGLFDPRMGVLEPGIICPTDGLDYNQCPGYPGHIELARPVFNILHMNTIVKLCKCVCYKCSKVLIDKNTHSHILEYPPDKRWDYFEKHAHKKKRCGSDNKDGCGYLQPETVKLEGFATIYATYPNLDTENNTIRLTPEMILKIFRRISDDDITFMGFHPKWARPEWMIYTVLPVAPPAVRPSVKYDAQQRCEDDLTHIYSNVLKTNMELSKKIEENAQHQAVESLTQVLQYFVAMISNNKVRGADPMSQRTGRPLQCISGRLNGKQGRIRKNLMGKRVDFSARSVITGDPNLSARQLGVPLKVAKNITKPVMVNDRNRAFLTQLIKNGPDVHPGAKILEKSNGESISLRHVNVDNIVLHNGDIVHRHMMDGDAVLFNRQPSLHRMSMMCFVVKVMNKGDTFRFNICATKGFNADFDGDEMNMHMPQNPLSESELRNLAAISHQMVSPANNAPIIGIFQDSLLGAFQFTRQVAVPIKSTEAGQLQYREEALSFTPRKAMNLLMSVPRVQVDRLRDAALATGRIPSFELLSQIMPPLTLQYKTKLYKDGDAKTSPHVLEIRNGEYIRGQMEKGVLGGGTKGLLHRICNDFGHTVVTDFIDQFQGIINEYMKTCSFSVGIKDLIADRTTTTKIVTAINAKKVEVQSLMDQVHLGVFKNETANTNMAELETRINNLLNKASEESGKLGRDSLDPSNRFVQIVTCGSKGSALNISQMVSCLGQQNVDGKRIPYGFENRTLPHYTKFDDSPNARGFIESSYITGLKPEEMFFHAMGGRIGLIDTACKTSQTGYIQRRLIKGLEDLKVEYDMTVRSSIGNITQFAYGEDGFDSMRVENQSLPLVTMSLEDIYAHFDLPELDGKALEVYTKEAASRLKKEFQATKEWCKRRIDHMIEKRNQIVDAVFQYKHDSTIRMPVAFQHLITNIQGQLNLNTHSAVDITPLEAVALCEETMARLKRLIAPPTPLFEVMFDFYLSPRSILSIKRFHRKALVVLLETIVQKYKDAIVHPGEMVGVVAGQSTGEPTTQLTLNSVTYETEIVVRNHQKETEVWKIGDFITKHIGQSEKIDYMKEKDTTYAEMNEFYEIQAPNTDGVVDWYRIEAVTKHPVINMDGSNTMLKFTTKGKREVVVTKAKSLLRIIDGKVLEANGDSFHVGDHLLVHHTNLKIRDKIYNYHSIDQITVEEDRDGRMIELEFDEIISIEEVPNTTDYAYDLTVESTRNFIISNGLCLRDTFHNSLGAGTKSNVTRGVPRIEEIMRLTSDPKNPSLTICLKSHEETDEDIAAKYAILLEHTRLENVVKHMSIIFDPNDANTRVDEDRLLVQRYREFQSMIQECAQNGPTTPTTPKSKWMIRMEMDSEKLLEKNITMDDIHFAIQHSFIQGGESAIECIYTDYNADRLVFRIRVGEQFIKYGKSSPSADPLDQSDQIYMLKNFQTTLLNNIVLRGVKNIHNVLPRKQLNMVVEEEGKFVRKDTWVLDTTGSNLMDVLALDYIDTKRTTSNSIREVFDVLGIEAAREVIFQEFTEVMQFSDVYINYHHLSLLVDHMCHNKDLVTFFRTGIVNDDIGPLAKATFETQTTQLLKAATHGILDPIRGVSANIMCGQYGHYGTSAFQTLLDIPTMMKMEETLDKENIPHVDIEAELQKLRETEDHQSQRMVIHNVLDTVDRRTQPVVCVDDGYSLF